MPARLKILEEETTISLSQKISISVIILGALSASLGIILGLLFLPNFNSLNKNNNSVKDNSLKFTSRWLQNSLN